MQIVVERKYRKEEYTIGKMYLNGEYFCDVCEDKDRGLDDSMTLSQIKKQKVYSKTAVPTGRYKVVSYYWAKYQKVYPMLLNIKGFTGVLIHKGRNAQDSAGCLLIGENKVKGGLINGEKYVRQLTQRVLDCEAKGEEVFITIR